MTDYPDIQYKREGHVATITLDRPEKMNSFSAEMQDSLYRAFTDAAEDRNIRVIILTGKGRAFCAGADVKQMAERLDEPGGAERDMTQISDRVSLYVLMQKCDKPIICAVNGVAAGGGLDLALACDIRIASDQARFAEVFIRRGMIPASGGRIFCPDWSASTGHC